MDYPERFPADELKEVLPNVYVVRGAMNCENGSLQGSLSRNMVVFRSGESLTIANSIVLDEDGEYELECLGRVRHVICLGSSHGRDDEYYLDRWGGELWLAAGSEHPRGLRADRLLVEGGASPMDGLRYISLATNHGFEGLLSWQTPTGNLIVSGDSIVNWESSDPYLEGGPRGKLSESKALDRISICPFWVNRMLPSEKSLKALCAMDFEHLIPGHGGVVVGGAGDKFRKGLGFERD